jgi:hypothetical protein
MENKPVEMTKRLAEFIVHKPASAIPETVFAHAKVALMD